MMQSQPAGQIGFPRHLYSQLSSELHMGSLVKAYSSCVTIVVLLGGHAARLLPFLKDLYDDLVFVLAIDCPFEIERLGTHVHAVHVQAFELGVNETAQTLCEEAPPELQEYLRTQGGMDASSGMGAAIAAGFYAGIQLVESADFDRFVRRTLLPRIRTATGGAVEAIRLVPAGSLAGGTYSGAQRPIMRGLSRKLLDLTSATVATHPFSTGGLVYEGIAEDPWANASASMMQQVSQCIDPKRSVREIRRLRLIEFGVLGEDEALRDAYLAQVEQASRSEYMKFDQQRRSPNEAMSGVFGNIQTWEAAFGSMLEIADDIAGVVQKVYGDRLRESLDCSDNVTAVDRIKADHIRVGITNESAEMIAAEAADHLVQWALSKLKSPAHRHTVSLQALISANEAVELTKYEALWATSPTTTAELNQRIQVQRRIIQLLKELFEELTAQVEEVEATEDAACRRFTKYHQRLTSRGLFGIVSSIVWSGARKFAGLTSAAVEIRDLRDELTAIHAEQAAVESALSFVERSHKYLTGKISRSLARFNEAGSPLGNRQAMVELHPLDDRLAELIAIVDEGEAEFLDWLRRSVSHATVFGLAKVCGALAPEIEEIARQIVYDRAYATPAVPWGGRRRADRGHRVHVLPPLNADVKRLVTEAVKKLNSETVITVADRAPAVINIVRIEMRVVTALEDILTAPYKLGLTEAVNSPCLLRYFPEGLEPLRSLGIYDFVTTTAKENPQCFFSFDV